MKCDPDEETWAGAQRFANLLECHHPASCGDAKARQLPDQIAALVLDLRFFCDTYDIDFADALRWSREDYLDVTINRVRRRRA